MSPSPPPVTLRETTMDDADLLRSWRNDPVVRAASGDTSPVQRETHARWLAALLADDDRRLWIGSSGGQPIGQVRADRSDPGTDAIISISVDQLHRRSGLGRHLLRAGIEAAWEWPWCNRLLAFIRQDNPTSQQLFRSLGFSSEDHGSKEYPQGPAMDRFVLVRSLDDEPSMNDSSRR